MAVVKLVAFVAVLAVAGAAETKKHDKRGILELHDAGHDFSVHDHIHTHGKLVSQVITNTVEVPVPHPYPVTVDKPVHYKVPVPVDRPYTVEVPKPYTVTVERPVPVAVSRPVPYTVRVPVKVPIVQRVEVPVPRPYTVQVDRPYAVEVPRAIIVEKRVPVYINQHASSFGASDLGLHVLDSSSSHHNFDSELLSDHYSSHGGSSAYDAGSAHRSGHSGSSVTSHQFTIHH